MRYAKIVAMVLAVLGPAGSAGCSKPGVTVGVTGPLVTEDYVPPTNVDFWNAERRGYQSLNIAGANVDAPILFLPSADAETAREAIDLVRNWPATTQPAGEAVAR